MRLSSSESRLDDEDLEVANDAALALGNGKSRGRAEIWKPGQISPPVSMEKQESVFQSLRSYAAQFGVIIEEKSEP